MKRYLFMCVLGGLGSLALAGVASASSSLPQPSTTRQLPGVPCSVTAYGIAFAGQGTNVSMNYAGGLSCSGGVGQKTIDVVPEVFNVVNGHKLWFSIGAAGLYQGPTPANPLRVSGSTSAVTSHIYRLVVFARVTMPNGHAASTMVCSGCSTYAFGPPPTLTISQHDIYMPDQPKSLAMKGLPKGVSCQVSEYGLVFSIVNNSYVMSYDGDTSCTGTTGQRSMKICTQTSNRSSGRLVWYTISGSCLTQKLTSANPVYLQTARTAYLGHGYRIMATGTAKVPQGSGTVTTTTTVYGNEVAP
jgi:hypothetical protein